MSDKVIARMEKNSREEIRFSVQEYRGTDLIDIRVYLDNAGEYRPTKKGISVPMERFNEFIRCLNRVVEKIFTEKK
jgi:hypothetical protein